MRFNGVLSVKVRVRGVVRRPWERVGLTVCVWLRPLVILRLVAVVWWLDVLERMVGGKWVFLVTIRVVSAFRLL